MTARGKLLKTKIKEAVLEASCVAAAVRVGSLQAENKVHKQKSMLDNAREHIGKMIDRTDPIKLGMLVATTMLVYQTLKGAEGFVDILRTKVPLVKVGEDDFGLFLRSVFGTTFFATEQDIIDANEKNSAFNLGKGIFGVTPEMLIALLVAYLLIYEPRAVAESMKALGGGIVGFAKSLGGIT